MLCLTFILIYAVPVSQWYGIKKQNKKQKKCQKTVNNNWCLALKKLRPTHILKFLKNTGSRPLSYLQK